MVKIQIKENELVVILDCYKNCDPSKYFQLIIDKETKELIERPQTPDIDASVAYSCVYSLLIEGKQLPKETFAEWG